MRLSNDANGRPRFEDHRPVRRTLLVGPFKRYNDFGSQHASSNLRRPVNGSESADVGRQQVESPRGHGDIAEALRNHQRNAQVLRPGDGDTEFVPKEFAEVRVVESGSRTLKDAINEALRDWVTYVRTTHYILGSVLGPDPYPRMVRDFHRVIGEEARQQLQDQVGRPYPDVAIACVGGGSNAIGLFSAFLKRKKVRLIGVEAGGRGTELGEHAARFSGGSLGVLHGTRTLVLQDEEGQVALTHSVSAGLVCPAIGPEHVALADAGRVEYTSCNDEEAIAAFHLLSATEGILPALESSHAIAKAMEIAAKRSPDEIILVCLSGRGDKDAAEVQRLRGEES